MKLNETIKSLRKANGNKTAAESTLTNITDYFDTGSMALNRVITGDVNKGFPSGRISCIFGPSQSGKSLIAAQTVANAFKQDKIDVCYCTASATLIKNRRKS